MLRRIAFLTVLLILIVSTCFANNLVRVNHFENKETGGITYVLIDRDSFRLAEMNDESNRGYIFRVHCFYPRDYIDSELEYMRQHAPKRYNSLNGKWNYSVWVIEINLHDQLRTLAQEFYDEPGHLLYTLYVPYEDLHYINVKDNSIGQGIYYKAISIGNERFSYIKKLPWYNRIASINYVSPYRRK